MAKTQYKPVKKINAGIGDKCIIIYDKVLENKTVYFPFSLNSTHPGWKNLNPMNMILSIVWLVSRSRGNRDWKCCNIILFLGRGVRKTIIVKKIVKKLMEKKQTQEA